MKGQVNSMDEPPDLNNVKQKKSDTKEYTLYDFIYMKFWKNADEPIVTESRSMVTWDREGGQALTPKGHRGSFWGDGNVLYVTVMLLTWLYSLAAAH